MRYRGKKLDEYKNNWNRQKRMEFEKEGVAIDLGKLMFILFSSEKKEVNFD